MLSAVLPIFFLILIGFGLKRSNFLNEDFWNSTERVTYYLLFPCLLITKVASADLSQINTLPLTLTLASSFFIANILAFSSKFFLDRKNNSFTSLHQGSIRFNTYIGLAIVGSLFGEDGLIIAVITASMLIPIINVTVVIVLQTHNTDTKQKALLSLLKNIASNPLILGCSIGLILNLINSVLIAPHSTSLPEILLTIVSAKFSTLKILGSTALPLGLLCVGAALTIKEFSSSTATICYASIIKLIIYPLIAFYCASYFKLDTLSQQIVTIFCALPTASASYIMAKKLGGDFQLMAQIITTQTLLSIFSLLLILHFINAA